MGCCGVCPSVSCVLAWFTSGKNGFHLPPLVRKQYGPGLKGALVPVRAAGVRPAPSPGS
jgi:hypothetical protein